MAMFQVSFMSQSLKRMVSFNAFLPVDADIGEAPREEKRFKTLYLLHGYAGDNAHWMTYAKIRELSLQNDLAIVMPSGENSFYLDIARAGRLYSRFIGSELPDFSRRIFPLSRNREDTFIGGLSMGGYGALYNGLKYHHTFSQVIALSSGFLTELLDNRSAEADKRGVDDGYLEDLAGGDIRMLRESDKNLEILAKQVLDSGENLPELYIACGYHDRMVYGNRKFSAYLQAIGYPHIYEEGAGTHEWAFWNDFLRRGVRRLQLVEPKAKTHSVYWIDAESDSPNPVIP